MGVRRCRVVPSNAYRPVLWGASDNFLQLAFRFALIFTGGVYGINIAKKVQQVFNLSEIPGAVQIRMGGTKGMLSLKKDFAPDCVGLRPSMVKFPSKHSILEVKAVARTNDSRDNKLFNQILLILYHLKTPNRVFLDLQALACASMASEFDQSFDLAGAERDIGMLTNKMCLSFFLDSRTLLVFFFLQHPLMTMCLRL
jgi:hypothetical protein